MTVPGWDHSSCDWVSKFMDELHCMTHLQSAVHRCTNDHNVLGQQIAERLGVPHHIAVCH